MLIRKLRYFPYHITLISFDTILFMFRLRRRFKEDKYGNISVGTVSDIATKEIGFQRNTLIGTYLRKAFPKVYVRRSDRLRWYCGISLPEKVLSDVEKERVAWLDVACNWYV